MDGPGFRVVQHRMSWWDAFCLGYGLGLGLILSQVSILGTAAIILAVIVQLSR